MLGDVSSTSLTPTSPSHIERLGPNAIRRVIEQLIARLEGHPELKIMLQRLRRREVAAHLAVMAEPYLAYVLDGRKTIESRFSTHRIAPFDRVESDDLILLKRPSGPIVGIALVSAVVQYRLDEHAWAEIDDRFGSQLCATENFYADRSDAIYATLMSIESVLSIAPITIAKRDRRGWVILSARDRQTNLF